MRNKILLPAIIVLFVFTVMGCAGSAFKKANNSNTGSAFKKANNSNTVEAYRAFLSEYPDSDYSKAAKDNIETLLYEHAMKDNTIAAYQSFLAEYPQGKYTDDAQLELWKKGWFKPSNKDYTGLKLKLVNIEIVDSLKAKKMLQESLIRPENSDNTIIIVSIELWEKGEGDIAEWGIADDYALADDFFIKYYDKFNSVSISQSIAIESYQNWNPEWHVTSQKVIGTKHSRPSTFKVAYVVPKSVKKFILGHRPNKNEGVLVKVGEWTFQQ